jgi:hypothetical protein
MTLQLGSLVWELDDTHHEFPASTVAPSAVPCGGPI